MLPSEILQCLLLVGSCLCVYGNPVRPPDIELEQDGDCYGPCTSLPPNTSSVQEGKAGPAEGGGGGGAADPRAPPRETSWPPQTANRGSADAGTGPSQVGGDQEGKAGSRDEAPVTSPPSGHPVSFTAAPQSSSSSGPAGGGSEEGGAGLPGAPLEDIEPGPSMGEEVHTPPSPRSPVPPMVFVSIQTSTPLSSWGHEGPPTLSVQEPLLPDMGSNLMPREDGPESLWTEATRPGGMDTAIPPSQDEATEGTMSSEALPLIFDPSEDVASEASPALTAAAVQPLLLPGATGPPAAGPPVEVDPEQLDTAEADGEGPSNAPPADWTSPETVAPLAPGVPLPTEGQADRVRTPGVEEEPLATVSAAAASSSSSSPVQPAVTTMVRMTTHPPVHKSRSGLEEMESEEESEEEEDEDEENSEESVEDESEEDLTDAPRTSPTQPPYSLIPLPPVWVQHDQGLMRSWVELIREKAGYVSGMLAPVGIGIMGALLIVGVLYSIRMIHRKRRNSFKHQRRKVRQPEQPREPGMSRQDQAMLLADSSEDEF